VRLPADWYRDPAVLELERTRIFTRSWQLAARRDEVAERGSYVASFAGHVPVVVVRDGAGRLNGFVNVCRHRGHLVAHGSGRRETLQCPYHAWTYGLDGCLQRAPRSEREPGFDTDGLSLLPVRVDTWGPLVFCNPARETGPLMEAVGDAPAAATFLGRQEWESPTNWKRALEDRLDRADGYCRLVWPNVTLALEQGRLLVELSRPEGPGRTVGYTDRFELAKGSSLPAGDASAERFRRLVVEALTTPPASVEPGTPSA
jgi:nitrite reductase/ring-hydroxylating ferredoxin subunit